ncbi:MAG: DUF3365 domain-containing protein [Thiohalocapsa sp.]
MAAGCGLALIGSLHAEPAADSNAAEAKAIIMEFFASLKGELEAAMKGGGPASAVVVCNARAPVIAAEMSERSGWDVGRTSLKLRNPGQNAPDDWEKTVLLDFEARKTAGEDVQTIAYAETIESDGDKTFRFMKAIPTSELCLTCHGTEIEPEIASSIDAAYPDDQAKGYVLGDIRGAFTLSKPL